MPRGKFLVKLDKMNGDEQCLFKLMMATRLSFAYKVGSLFIVQAETTELLLRYMNGQDDAVEPSKKNIKLIEGDLIETENRVYTVNKVTRCPKDRLVFVEAVLAAKPNEKTPFFPVAA